LPWYFDFISPFAYLQWRRLRRDRPDLVLVPKPLLFAGLLTHYGQLGPAEIPEKRRHTYRIALWQARELGIPMRAPPSHPFNPLPALRLCVAAAASAAAVDAIFAQAWEHGEAIDSADALRDVARRLGIVDVAAAIGAEAVKSALSGNGAEAIARGVFGVPTLVIGARQFWGNDATAMALAYLDDPAVLDADPEFLRAEQLPVGQQRKQVNVEKPA
jgi:2-hydroxychromene-2-carboxylate isomerase